ncbi:alpha/beta hydrolase [Emcibacter sp. SYSU 3D8]|uniref:alpha/beta fold hydrolase n=1 Tax=Emcibacter sp. SYSU 3D8 TaxID=3133969 RepID=UPI0031FED4C5
MSSADAPLLRTIDLGDIEIAYAEWRPHLKGDGPSLYFVHGTSFHGRVWDEVIENLREFHCIAVDQRGHGRSTGGPISHWRTMGADQARLIPALGLDDFVGIGHSMGAHALLDGGATCQDRFRHMVVIDPMVPAPADYETGHMPFLKPGELHPASRRKRHFASPQEMYDRFQSRHPYSLFSPATLWKYCTYGLVPGEKGDGFDLACAPEMEASVYTTSRTNVGVFDSIARLEVPVLLLRAHRSERAGLNDFASSPTWPGLVGAFRNGREIYYPDRTHFLPMEVPIEVAETIREDVEHEY